MHQMILEDPHELLLLVVFDNGQEELQWVPVMVPGAPSYLLIPSVTKIV